MTLVYHALASAILWSASALAGNPYAGHCSKLLLKGGYSELMNRHDEQMRNGYFSEFELALHELTFAGLEGGNLFGPTFPMGERPDSEPLEQEDLEFLYQYTLHYAQRHVDATGRLSAILLDLRIKRNSDRPQPLAGSALNAMNVFYPHLKLRLGGLDFKSRFELAQRISDLAESEKNSNAEVALRYKLLRGEPFNLNETHWLQKSLLLHMENARLMGTAREQLFSEILKTLQAKISGAKVQLKGDQRRILTHELPEFYWRSPSGFAQAEEVDHAWQILSNLENRRDHRHFLEAPASGEEVQVPLDKARVFIALLDYYSRDYLDSGSPEQFDHRQRLRRVIDKMEKKRTLNIEDRALILKSIAPLNPRWTWDEGE